MEQRTLLAHNVPVEGTLWANNVRASMTQMIRALLIRRVIIVYNQNGTYDIHHPYVQHVETQD